MSCGRYMNKEKNLSPSQGLNLGRPNTCTFYNYSNDIINY